MEYPTILRGLLTDNLCQYQLVSDINEQNNLQEVLFSMDEMTESNILIDLRVNNNTNSCCETQSEYVTNPNMYLSPIQDNKNAFDLSKKNTNSRSVEQPKNIIFQPLNLAKEHNSTNEEFSENVAKNTFVVNKKRKAESSSLNSPKLKKKDEVCKNMSQGSLESIFTNEKLVYIMIKSDFMTNIRMGNDPNALIPEAKCFYLTTPSFKIYYYYIPEDSKIPSEKRFYNELHLTIHNIPFNIELFIELNDKNDKDVIVNEKYSDTQDNKLFVYNRTFKLFYKEKQCAWNKISVSVQKSELSTIMKKFIYPISLQKYKFPVYDIPKLIELNKQVETNRVVWLKDEIIKESNLVESICVFAKDAFSTSRISLESTNNQRKNKQQNFEALKKISEICDYELWSISDPTSSLYGMNVESNIKIFLDKLRNAIKFSGLAIIRTEPLTEEQIELISLIAFINENVVNFGLKYLDKYDKLIGKKIKFNELFIIELD